MPVIITIDISGHGYIPEKFSMNFKRQLSVQGIPTSESSWGTLTFSLILEMERDSDTFLASWMSAPYQTYTVDIACLNTLSNQTFLNIKMENTMCVNYSIDSTGSPAMDNPVENNGLVNITLSSPRVTVGQAVIGVPVA